MNTEESKDSICTGSPNRPGVKYDDWISDVGKPLDSHGWFWSLNKQDEEVLGGRVGWIQFC